MGAKQNPLIENSLENYRSTLNQLGFQSPVENTDQFQLELEMDDRSFKRLLDKNAFREIWSVVAAGISGAEFMGSSFVAATLFSEVSILALVGLGSTPVGWVLAGAIASGAMCYFVRKWAMKDDDNVRAPSKYINRPVDMLAIQLIDLMVPLMLKVAKADGEICDNEREEIVEVLRVNWGYNPLFVVAALKCIEGTFETYSDRSIDELASNLAKFARSCPNINERKFCDHLVQRLDRIARSDLLEYPEEIESIHRVRRSIDKQLSRKRIELIMEWMSAIRSIHNRMGIKVSNAKWLLEKSLLLVRMKI